MFYLIKKNVADKVEVVFFLG